MKSLQIGISDRKDLKLKEYPSKTFTIFESDGTSYLLCLQTLNFIDKTLTISDGINAYICNVLRFVNLNFFKKLKVLLGTIKRDIKEFKEWPALYEISSFRKEEFKVFQTQSVSYGEDVLVSRGLKLLEQYEKRTVCNCFNQGGQIFYFIDNQTQNQKEKNDLRSVFDLTKHFILGISLNINDILLYLPFEVLLFNRPSIFKIHPSINHILSRTVYLQINGTYSTGTIIENNKILTVKHAFSGSKPELGTVVNAKTYPYLNTFRAKLCTKSKIDELDAVILSIESQKQYHQENNKSVQENIVKLQLQPLSSQTVVKIGQNIQTVGFGKYNYSLNSFKEVDMLMPTLMRGIISKRIEIDDQLIAFKTDAHLYHGFSGCSIWRNNVNIGMAVFIIKNSTTLSYLTKHNFSLCTSFIKKYLFLDEKDDKNGEIQYFLKGMGNFGVRKHMRVIPKL